MSEISGGIINEVQQVVPAPKTGIRSFLHWVRQGVGSIAKEAGQVAGEAIFVGGEKIPLEKISPETLAWEIQTSIGNPVQDRLGGGRYVNGFTVTTAMSNAGYITEGDNMQRFPRERTAFGQSLQQLVAMGILVREPQTSDHRKETIQYKVIDEEGLGKLAVQGRELLHKK